jgi:trk system potassium uptake protein TrkA
MRILVVGAGQVGSTIVESLNADHDITVVDIDGSRLAALSHRFDVKTFVGSGGSRRTLLEAGIESCDLIIACTSRDEPNIIAAMLARKLAPTAKTIVRTTNVEYLEVWHERLFDVDFIVSSELETALAISRLIGVPAARQTDVFASGQVQIVEFDVEQGAVASGVIGKPLREAKLPPDSRVAGIIRGDRMIPPFGRESIQVGDRVIIIGSPHAARSWSKLVAHETARVENAIIFGGGRIGIAVGRVLLEQEIGVRVLEVDRDRAREVAELLPKAKVLNVSGFDPAFLQRERIGKAQVVILAMRNDERNLYAGVLTKLQGKPAPLTIGVVHETGAAQVYEAAGIDVVLNPRELTAEEIVRFAHDPRTQQVAMLEGDRFEILDVTCRSESPLVGKPLRELPATGSFVGAIVRDGVAIFPHGNDQLKPGDRAILFTESTRAVEVEQAL